VTYSVFIVLIFIQRTIRSTCCSQIYGFLLRHHWWARGEKSLTGYLCVRQLVIGYRVSWMRKNHCTLLMTIEVYHIYAGKE